MWLASMTRDYLSHQIVWSQPHFKEIHLSQYNPKVAHLWGITNHFIGHEDNEYAHKYQYQKHESIESHQNQHRDSND